MDSAQLYETSRVKGKGKGKGKSSAKNTAEMVEVASCELKLDNSDPYPCNSSHNTCGLSPLEVKSGVSNNFDLIPDDQKMHTSEVSSASSNTVSVIVSNPKMVSTRELQDKNMVDKVARLTTDVKNVELAKKRLFPDDSERSEVVRDLSKDAFTMSSTDNFKLVKIESLVTDRMPYVDTNETIDNKYKQPFKKVALHDWENEKSEMEHENSNFPDTISSDMFQEDCIHDSILDVEDWCSCLPNSELECMEADPEIIENDCIKKLCRKRLYDDRPNLNDDSFLKKFRSDDSQVSVGRIYLGASSNSDANANITTLSTPNPPELQQWINNYESWSNNDKNRAIDALIKISTTIQVRHMMKTIEPLFQTDFISLLPKELALIVLSYLDPEDLSKVSQTCRYWRFLANDYLLWKKMCLRVGITPTQPGGSVLLSCPTSVNPFKWAFMNQHLIERNWMTRSSSEAVIMRGHDDHVITCLQCDGDRIVSGSDDTTLKVWSTITGECLLTLVGHSGGVWSCQMTDDVIVSGSTDRTLRVWNADTGVCLNTLSGHTSTVRCMRLFEDKVVSGSRDATLRVWSIPRGDCLQVLVGHMAAVRCVQYDGKFVVSGAYDFFVKIWNPDTGECLHTLAGHTNRVYSLQFDGINVVSGSLDTSICVWDAVTGQLKHTLVGHTSLITSMELHGNILISGNADSTLKVWDISTGQCLHTLAGANKHQSAVTYVQSTNRFVISSSDDGTVKLWDLRTGEFIRNIVQLGSGGAGGNVLRIRASNTQLVCAVGSRNGTEETKLMLMNFDRKDQCEKCSEYY